MKKKMLFAEFVDLYFKNVVLADSTEYAMRKMLDKPKVFFLNKEVREITEWEIQEFVESLKEQGKKENTIKNYLKNLRPIFQWAEDNKYITKNPCVSFNVSVVRQERKRIGKEEVESILVKMSRFNENLYLATLLLLCGLHREELCCLRWEDIDLDKRVITIDKKIKQLKGGCKIQNTKVKKIRIPGTIVKQLSQYKNLNGSILSTNRSEYISPVHLNYLFRQFKSEHKMEGMLKDFNKIYAASKKQ